VNFPCNVQVKKFRIQGIQALLVGGSTPELEGETDTLVTVPREVEFWCNDGCDWYSLRQGAADKDDDWELLTSLISQTQGDADDTA